MKKKLDKPVLAEGEKSGHAHVLDADVDVYIEDDGVRTFENTEPAPLVHQEHQKVVLPPKEWASDRVVEYDPFAGERKVVD